ncbi:MAG: hypothetical protein RLZZ422_2309, partial [Pseudomonadota bacterium]
KADYYNYYSITLFLSALIICDIPYVIKIIVPAILVCLETL